MYTHIHTKSIIGRIFISSLEHLWKIVKNKLNEDFSEFQSPSGLVPQSSGLAHIFS